MRRVLVVVLLTSAACGSAARRAAPPRSTTSTRSTAASTTTTTPVSSTAATIPTLCTSCTPTTDSVPAVAPAQAGDFTGVFQHWRNTCDVCAPGDLLEKGFTLTIRNTTHHPIDLSTAAPVRVAVVCATGVTVDGQLTGPLRTFTGPGSIFVDHSIGAGGQPAPAPDYATPGNDLAPGAEATNDPATGYTFVDDPPGTVTCEGALVATADGSWSQASLSVVARLASFPTYSFELTAPPSTTAVASTTTTA